MGTGPRHGCPRGPVCAQFYVNVTPCRGRLASLTATDQAGGAINTRRTSMRQQGAKHTRTPFGGLVVVSLVAVVLLVLTAGLFGGACGSGRLPSAGDADDPEEGDVTINGAGATFPRPLYIEWIGEYQLANPGVRLNYQGIGSGGGIEQFTRLTVDFGGSDAPMKDEEIAAAEAASGSKVLHIPTVFGSIVLAYNLEGVSGVKLDPLVLTAVFLGEITSWNDPRIVALNPGVRLPDSRLQVVHRSDASGTTAIFTEYLSAVSTRWHDLVGSGKDVDWPVGLGGQGNDGVSAVIQQQPGSIGYVEYSYAVETGLPMASLQNRAGNFVAPSLEATSAAALTDEYPDDLRFSVADSAHPDAYPIAGATWVLAYEQMRSNAKAQALKDWLVYALNEGTPIAEELGYAPLPEELKALALLKVAAIRGF